MAKVVHHGGGLIGGSDGDGSSQARDELPGGTPLDIAALPNANQVTIHSEDDASGHHAQAKKQKQSKPGADADGKKGSGDVEASESKQKQSVKVRPQGEISSTTSKAMKKGRAEKMKKPKKTKGRSIDSEKNEASVQKKSIERDEGEASAPPSRSEREAVADSDVEDDGRDQNDEKSSQKVQKYEEEYEEERQGGQQSADSSQDPLLSSISNRSRSTTDESNGSEDILTQRKVVKGDLAQVPDAQPHKSKQPAQNAGRNDPPTYIDLSQYSDEDDMPLTQWARADVNETHDPLMLVTKRRHGGVKRKTPGLSTKQRDDKLPRREDSAAELDHEPQASGLTVSSTDGRSSSKEEIAKDRASDTGAQQGELQLDIESEETKQQEQFNLGRPSSQRIQPQQEVETYGDKGEDRGWYRKIAHGREEEQTDRGPISDPPAASDSTGTEDKEQQTSSQKERKRKEKGKEKEGKEDEAEEDDQDIDIRSSGMPAPSQEDYNSPLASQPTCPVCSKSIKHLDMQAREAHVNSCIDNQKQQSCADDDFVNDFKCEICGKTLTKWNAQRRQQHMERCLDKLNKNITQQDESQQNDEPSGEITDSRYRCPICKMDRSKSALVARIEHLKKCAKKHNLSIDAFRNAKRWNEMVSKIEAPSVAAPGAPRKPKRTAKEPKKKATTTTRRTKRTRKKNATENNDESADKPATSEVRSKFFSEGVDAVSHANFLATIAKLRYKKGATAAKDSSAAEQHAEGTDRQTKSISTATESSTSEQPAASIATVASVGASSSSSVAQPQPTSESIASTSCNPTESGEDEDFEQTVNFKRPPALAPKKPRTTRTKKMNYDELVQGMNEEDEDLMLAVALSDSLAPAPPTVPADQIDSSPESSHAPRDLAGFRLQEPKPIVATEAVKDLFPDASQEIQPTPKLAESALAKKKSPQPARRASLWNLSSSGAGAYDPEFTRTSVLPPSDKKQLADKAKLHPQVTPDMLDSALKSNAKQASAVSLDDNASRNGKSSGITRELSDEGRKSETENRYGEHSQEASEDITQIPMDLSATKPPAVEQEKVDDERPQNPEDEAEEAEEEDPDEYGGWVTTQFPLPAGDVALAEDAVKHDEVKSHLEEEPCSQIPLLLRMPSSQEKISATTKLRHKLQGSDREEKSDYGNEQHSQEEHEDSQPLTRRSRGAKSDMKPAKRRITAKREDANGDKPLVPLDSADEISSLNASEDEEAEATDLKSDRRKKQFVIEAENVMQDYKLACAEAERLMEERIKEIKAAYLAEIGRITIEKENRMQRLQRKYQVTSSLFFSPFSSNVSTISESAPSSISHLSLGSNTLPLKQEKKRKLPNKLSLNRSKRTKRRSIVHEEEEDKDVVEIGPSQLVYSKKDPYANDSDEDFKPTKQKKTDRKSRSVEMTARKRKKKDDRGQNQEEMVVQARRESMTKQTSRDRLLSRKGDARRSDPREERRELSAKEEFEKEASKKRKGGSSDDEEDDEEALETTPSPIQKKSMYRRREDDSSDDEKRSGGGRRGGTTSTTAEQASANTNHYGTKEHSNREAGNSKSSTTTKTSTQQTSNQSPLLDTELPARNGDQDGASELQSNQLARSPLKLADAQQSTLDAEQEELSGRPMDKDISLVYHYGGLDSYGFGDDLPSIVSHQEVVRIELHSSPPQEEGHEPEDIQEERHYPGDPLSFIITKKRKPSIKDHDVPMSESDNEANKCELASTPPEDLGPASPTCSSASTTIPPSKTTLSTASIRATTSVRPTMLRPMQEEDEEDHLSPWSARILANKKKKQQQTRTSISRTEVHRNDDGSSSSEDGEDDQQDLFASPTPPPPPLPPISPLASVTPGPQAGGDGHRLNTEPPHVIISSQGDLNGSPLLFTPVQCPDPASRSPSTKAPVHPPSRGSVRLVTDLDYDDQSLDGDDYLDDILHSAKTTRKEKSNRPTHEDSDQEVTTSQEAAAERNRLRTKVTARPPARQVLATKSKKGKKTSSEDEHDNGDNILLTPPIVAGLMPLDLTPRELLRSPISSLTKPTSPYAMVVRSTDKAGATRQAKRRLRDVVNDEADKENAVNRNPSKRGRTNDAAAAAFSHETRTDKCNGACDDDHGEETVSVSCTPRTTLSLHSKRCHHTPKPAYADMSDSLLKTVLSGFGVRSGSRKWMIEKLSEIWDASHEPSKALPLDHPSIVQGVKLFAHEKEDDPKKKEKEKELAQKVTAWVKSNKRIYLRVLQYKEVDLLELQSALKEGGIKCGRDFLASYLNAQGVVFRGPPKKKRQGWHM